MAFRKRKKKSRQRASMTHGWGAKKKHRGSGNRGGFGMAGTGKRADAKKSMIWKDILYFGKHGFKKKGIKHIITPINLKDVEAMLHKLVAEKKITKEGDRFIINLISLGYNKLLGTGDVSHKMKISVEYASGRAIDKVTEKGGEVLVAVAKEE